MGDCGGRSSPGRVEKAGEGPFRPSPRGHPKPPRTITGGIVIKQQISKGARIGRGSAMGEAGGGRLARRTWHDLNALAATTSRGGLTRCRDDARGLREKRGCSDGKTGWSPGLASGGWSR